MRHPDQGGGPVEDLLVQPFRDRQPGPGGRPVGEDQQDVEASGRQQQEHRAAHEPGHGVRDEAGRGEEPVQQAEEREASPEGQAREGGPAVDQPPARPVDRGGERVEAVIVTRPLGPGEERVDGREPVLDDRAGQRRVLDEVDDRDGPVEGRAGVDIDERVGHDAEPQDCEGHDGAVEGVSQAPQGRPQRREPQGAGAERRDRDAGRLDQQPAEGGQEPDPEQRRAQDAVAGCERAEAEDAGQAAQGVAGQENEGNADQCRDQDAARIREGAVHRRAAFRKRIRVARGR
ncbi:hypothetical protein [Methylobacterium oryzae]|uniref:hypothetical protein n=1 Tax=Methylobacterium oryzae TaxID=334852 RepID=UPI002F350F5C